MYIGLAKVELCLVYRVRPSCLAVLSKANWVDVHDWLACSARAPVIKQTNLPGFIASCQSGICSWRKGIRVSFNSTDSRRLVCSQIPGVRYEIRVVYKTTCLLRANIPAQTEQWQEPLRARHKSMGSFHRLTPTKKEYLNIEDPSKGLIRVLCLTQPYTWPWTWISL